MANPIPIKTIDDYMTFLPLERRITLEIIRQTIIDMLPEYSEEIYQDYPMIFYKGNLIGFSSSKDFLSLYLHSPKVIDQLKEELKDFKLTNTTIHFTLEHPIPPNLLEKIVKLRMMENETKGN